MQPRQDHSPASEHGGEREQYLTFNLSGELFAIGILS
ncbi:MAG: chemotaxis protein CheW, partial [Rhodocyclaceae bacterium]